MDLLSHSCQMCRGSLIPCAKFLQKLKKMLLACKGAYYPGRLGIGLQGNPTDRAT
jgi:hypothetical protein